MKKKKRKKKRKPGNHNKARVFQQKASLAAHIESWLNLFAEMSSAHIIEGLLTSDDGKFSLWVSVPGVPGEIEMEFLLEDLRLKRNGDTKEVFNRIRLVS